MFQSIKLLEGMIDTTYMEAAKNNADPISKLDLQFALMEKNKINAADSKRVLDFDAQVKIIEKDYRNSLKTKTIEAQHERVQKWNDWWFEYYKQRVYTRVNRYTGEVTTFDPLQNWKSEGAKTPWHKMVLWSQRDAYYQKYGVTGSDPSFFKRYREVILNHSHGKVLHMNKSGFGWLRVLADMNWASRGTDYSNPYHMWILLKNAFPSVSEYEKNPDAYYYLVDFMENVPFPTPALMDAAAKKACYYGKKEYADDAKLFIEAVSDWNMNPKAENIYIFNPPEEKGKHTWEGEQAETTYGMPELNPNYSEQFKRDEEYQVRLRNCTSIRTTSGTGIKYCPTYSVKRLSDGRYVYQVASYFSDKSKAYVRYNSAPTWYWPRPRDGYLYVPGWGFILPEKFVGVYVSSSQTPWGFAEAQRRAAEKARRRAERRRGGSFVQKVVRGMVKMNTRSGFWEGLGEVVGNVMREFDPVYQINRIARQTPILSDIHRELENLSGGLGAQLERVSDIPAKWVRGEPVTEQDLMEALDVAVKVVIIVASQGSATAIVGVVSSQLSRGSWGDDEVGRIFLAIGEIAAIAYASNSSFTKALGSYAEKQAVGIIKREIYKANTDADIFGTFLIELSVNSGYSYSKGETTMKAFTGAAEKSALIAVARQSPEAALAAMAFSEIKKNGIQHYIPDWDTLTSPEEWFDDFDWSKLGQEFVQMAKNADKKDIKKITGLAMMMATGRLDGQTALGMIGQEIAIRQIQRFHEYQPAGAKKDAETISYEKAFREMQQAKNEDILFSKVARGHIPSVSEMETIIDSGSANWMTSKISNALSDEEGVAMLWDLQFKIGIPEWAKIGSVEMPEWAKVDKIDMPGWSKIEGDEKWVKKLDEEWEKFKRKLTSRENLLKMFESYLQTLWPPGTPLRRPGTDIINYVNYTGFVEVRDDLNFAYDHPMVKVGYVDKNYSDEQKQYLLARELEVKQAEMRLAEIERQLSESGTEYNQMG